MWRRVASQSPAAVPTNRADKAASDRYLLAWDALSELLAQGRSLSGHERNCCYLNTRGIEFANASFVSGFDFPSDSRGLALVDWDHDGDVDVWQSNRTSPRLRFLRNSTRASGTSENPTQHLSSHWVSLKLQGQRCNRDAIGARVAVKMRDAHTPMVRTLRAGEGYLAQSSKRLHFGLGADTAIESVTVHWPDGSIEQIENVAADRHYVIVQGKRMATEWIRPGSPSGVVQNVRANLPEPAATTRRILPHRRLPIPTLQFIDAQGQEQTVAASSPTFVVIWASWCVPCLAELKELSQHQARLAEQGISIVAISVDDLPGDTAAGDTTSGNAARTGSAEQRQPFVILDRLKISGSHGIATEVTKIKLDLLQRSLQSRQRALAIPSSMLLDDQGRLAAVYQGRVSVEQIVADVAMIRQPNSDTRDQAVPLPGRWFVGEIPPDLMSVAGKLSSAQLPLDALVYLDQHVLRLVDSERSSKLVWPQEQIASAYLDVGVQLGKAGARDEAERAMRTSIRLAPQQLPARAALANLLEASKRYRDALETYEAMLAVRPENPVVLNNMAWIYVSAADPSVRDPRRGVVLAERACEITQHRVVAMLDTLASAYAANGDRARAEQTWERAIEQARLQGNQQSAAGLEAKRARLRDANP
jgi:tetratricopeptide (TPR) repeat protein